MLDHQFLCSKSELPLYVNNYSKIVVLSEISLYPRKTNGSISTLELFSLEISNGHCDFPSLHLPGQLDGPKKRTLEDIISLI
jgi:hypothetical protein